MKQKIKKLTSILFVMLMLVSNVLLPNTLVQAKEHDVEVKNHTPYGYYITAPDGEHWQWNSKTAMIYIDDKLGFCIDPGMLLDASYPVYEISMPQLTALSDIAFVGYWDTKQTAKDYTATQFYIWEYMGGVFDKNHSSWNFTDYPSYKKKIQDDLKKLDKYPSFKGTSYTVKVGETLRIKDTNGVLSDFHVVSNGGADVRIEGNELVITPNANTDTNPNIRLQKGDNKYVGTPIAYSSGVYGQQNIAWLPIRDPKEMRINLTVQKQGGLKIVKVDEDNAAVSNAQFKLSYNANMSSPIGTYTTGSNGTVTVDNIDIGTVYIQEVATPEHLVLDSNVYSATIRSGQTTTFDMTNYKKRGDLTIKKQDEDGTPVPNTSFKLSYNANMSNPIGTYTTGSNGSVKVEDLLARTVYIQETSVPSHLLLDSTVKSATVQYNNNVNFTAKNNWKKGTIQVVKKDVDTSKTVTASNTTFNVHREDGTIVNTITTNSEGKATLNNVRYGKWYLTEKTAPNKYTHSDEKIHYNVTENGKTYVGVINNKRVTGTLNLSKVDSEYANIPQGEATLEGAVYGLYARKDILDPSDDSIVYKANTKIKELVTDENGNASVDNLYLGDYFIKEIASSNGYTLDTTEYDLSLTYQNQNVSVVTKNQTVNEKIKSQAFEIIKISSDGSSNNDVETLAGVEFTYILKEYVDKYNDFDTALAEIKAGKTDILSSEWGVMTTDNKGYACSKELPFGTYVVRETKTLENYSPVKDFEVTVKEDSRTPQAWRVLNNESYKSVVAIIKKDIDTNNIIQVEGASFKIKNLDTDKYFGYWQWNPLPHYVDTWTTDESGTVMTGEVLPFGKYQLEEIASPNNYLVSDEPIPFSVSSDDVVQILPDTKTPVLTIIAKDKAVTGTIEIEKRGEVLVDYKDGEFVYEERALEGATFEVKAKEDILDPSNNGDVLHTKGELVDTVTTKANGIATTKPLPLGKYEVIEKTAPNGMVVDTTPQEVTLSYEDDKTPTVNVKANQTNPRQTVKASLTKLDDDGETGIKGATFELIANADIINADNEVIVAKDTVLKAYTTNDEGKFTVDLDLPLNNSFKYVESKAPIGYEADKTPVNFETSYVGQDVEVLEIHKEKGNIPTKLIVSKQDATNNQELANNILTIYEKDNKGASFTTWTSSDKPQVIEYLSVDTRYILEETSAKYGFYLADPVEFEIDEDGLLWIFDKEGNKSPAEDNLIVVENELVKGKITIEKTGETLVDYKDGDFVYEERALEGATFEVKAKEDIINPSDDTVLYKKGEIVDTVTTNEKGIAIADDLYLGMYDVYEVQASHGMVLNQKVQTVDVNSDDQSQKVVSKEISFTNPRQTVKLSIFKKDIDETTLLSGAEYDFIANEDILNVKGKVIVTKDTVLSHVLTDENGEAKINLDLPLDFEFKFVETKAPIGFTLNEKPILVTTEYQGQDYAKVDYSVQQVNTPTEITVSKIDSSTNEELAGNILTIYEKDNKGASFTTWTSSDKPEKIKNLSTDTRYILEETSSVKGFDIAKPVEFEIDVHGKLYIFDKEGNKSPAEDNLIVVENDLVKGKLVWSKTGEIFDEIKVEDSEYGEIHTPVWHKDYLLQAEITIYAFEDITLGNGITYYKKDEAIQTLESDLDEVESLQLPVGKYYYLETKTPHGRIPNTEKHYFEVEDTHSDKLQEILLELENKRPTYKLDFIKHLETNDVTGFEEAYKDVVYGVYATDDTYDYMGNVLITADTLVGLLNIDEKGQIINLPNLPTGNYYIKELATNSAYTLDSETKHYFSIEDTNKAEVVVTVDKNTATNTLKNFSVQVDKVDANTGKKVVSADFEFGRYLDPECTKLIDTASAKENTGTALFDDVHYGVTYIRELKAPLGYKLSDEVVKVEVNDEGVFVNDKKVESKDEIYSFVYVNSLLPVIATGDDGTIMSLWTALAITSSSLLVVAVILLKRKKNAE